jgi:hypothetical protein
VKNDFNPILPHPNPLPPGERALGQPLIRLLSAKIPKSGVNKKLLIATGYDKDPG